MTERSEATQIALITSRNQLLVTILAGLFGLAATWLAGRSTGERHQQAKTAMADNRIAAVQQEADERERTVTDLRRQLAQARAACSSGPSESSGGQPASSTPPPKGDVVSAEGFTIARRSCELKGDELVCEFLATAEREDASLDLYSWSRLVESDGNEMLASRIRFGRDERVGQSQSVRVDLVRGVPVGMTVRFAGLKTASTSATVPLIELFFSGFRAQFRNVRLRPS